MRYIILPFFVFLAGCQTDRIVVKPNTVLIIPNPVICPEEPKIETDPDNDKFTERMIVDYISKLRESHNICRSSKELQDKQIEELKTKYESINKE